MIRVAHVIEADLDLTQRTVSSQNSSGVTFGTSLRRTKSLRKNRGPRPQSAYIPRSPSSVIDNPLNQSIDEALKNLDIEQWFKDSKDTPEIADVPLQVLP